jgi:hypothetical protein
MDFDKMSREELFKIYDQIGDRLGLYQMVTMSIEDVKDHLEGQLNDDCIESMPSNDQIKAACGYVWKKQDGQDWFSCVEWASEVAVEFSHQDKEGEKVNA